MSEHPDLPLGYAPIYSTDPLPGGDWHAGLMDEHWRQTFCFLASITHDDVRELLLAMRVAPTGWDLIYARAMASLDRLRQWLVDTAAAAGPVGVLLNCDDAKEAYEAACRMFSTLKEKIDAREDFVPLQALAYIRAKLAAEDPAPLLRDADELWEAAVARRGARGPLEATLTILAGSPRGTEVVRYLAGRPGRYATLRQLAVDVFNRKTITDNTLRNTRRHIERTDDKLDVEGAPLRLTIVDNTVYIR